MHSDQESIMNRIKLSGPEAGFSLIELMVAMVVTLVISAGIYGLMASSESSFKRDPELTERQQNIRVAMDVIQRDLSAAGNKMGPFYPVFLTGLNSFGPASPSGSADALQIFTNNGECPDVASAGPPNGANFLALNPVPNCYKDDSFVLVLYGNTGAKFGFAHNIHAQNKMVNFPSGLGQPAGSQITCNDELAAWCPSSPPGNCSGYLASCAAGAGTTGPTAMTNVSLIRYEIANEADGVPGLWRSDTGGMTVGGAGYVPAGPGRPNWQLVARGIEDLQVQYRTGTNWLDDPGTPTSPDYNTIIREVRVTLGARTVSTRGLQGATTSAVGSAVRGQLVSETAPRSALFYLNQNPAGAQWH